MLIDNDIINDLFKIISENAFPIYLFQFAKLQKKLKRPTISPKNPSFSDK